MQEDSTALLYIELMFRNFLFNHKQVGPEDRALNWEIEDMAPVAGMLDDLGMSFQCCMPQFPICKIGRMITSFVMCFGI